MTWLMSVFMLVWSSCQCFGDERPDIPLTDVIQGLLKWQQSVSSLRVTAITADREELKLIDPSFPMDAVLDGKDWGLRTTLWYEQPFRFWFCHENLVQGQVDVRQAGAVDGFRYWIGYSSGGPVAQDSHSPLTHLEVLSLHPLASPMHYVLWTHPLREYCRIPALKGIWHEGRCCWVGDWLGENSTTEVTGYESVDGFPCVMVEARHRDHGTTGVNIVEQWWFDPALQYLPRRYIRTGPATPVSGEMVILPTIWSVAEFRRIGEDSWFPHSGTYTRQYLRGRTGRLTTQSIEWLILESESGRSIPAEQLLAPEPTEETMIYSNDFDPSASRIRSANWRDPDPSAGSPSAAAPAWFLDPAVLVLSGVFVLGGCVLLIQRLRQHAAERQNAVLPSSVK